MMPIKGFFSEGQTDEKKIQLFHSPRCGQCGLDKGCQSPKMPVDGRGVKKILIVAEGPGRTEDEKGIPLCGKTGSFFEETISEFGIDMREDCWLTNSVRCRTPSNRTPTDKEISYCRPWLTSTSSHYGDIRKLNPEKIILLGGPAVKSVIGWLWKEDPGGVNRWIGWKIPCQKLNAWISCVWHPSFVTREKDAKNPNRAVELIWKRQLKEAFALKGRPWKKVPDYKSQVTVELVPRQAAYLVREITRMGKPAAFDYESNMLKPDGDKAMIRSCSVSNGVITVAYPWSGEAIKATQEFIQSPVPKIASNAKFEERWTAKFFGHGVNNWAFDTMLAAHLLDNRPEITSIKYQAFVLLGQPGWEDGAKVYFDSGGPNVPNKIKDMDLRTLCIYNGMDSLMEIEVAKIQARQMGIEL